MPQANLPGVDCQNHAHRGRDFELALERTHEFYEMRGLADIARNPVEWERVSKRELDEALKRRRITNNQWAEIAGGGFLIQKQSKVDFEGGGRVNGKGFSILFDAKETSAKSIPLDNFRRHQVESLSRGARCGRIAGFMIRFVASGGRVFFAPAQFVADCFIAADYQNQRKSISIKQLETSGIEIPATPALVDWLPVLTK